MELLEAVDIREHAASTSVGTAVCFSIERTGKEVFGALEIVLVEYVALLRYAGGRDRTTSVRSRPEIVLAMNDSGINGLGWG